MELESVDKILKISITYKNLSRTFQALRRVITDLDGNTEEMIKDINDLKEFCGRLDKILINVRDY